MPRSKQSRQYHRSLETDPKTSARLARVRQKDTKPELAVRRILWELGHRYRVRNRDLPGSPDIANRFRGWAVFVHGCFWHRHPGCRRKSTPKRNAAFWEAKFATNQRRDARVARQLRAMGFRVIRIWECQAEKPEAVRKRLARLLQD